MRGRKPSTILQLSGPSGAKAKRAPAWFGAAAKAEWARAYPALLERRVITEADLGTFEAYCLAVGQVRELADEIAALTDRYVYSEAGTPRPHPAFRLQHEAMRQARQLAAELGLTPVSRSRASMTAKGDNDDGWSDMDL